MKKSVLFAALAVLVLGGGALLAQASYPPNPYPATNSYEACSVQIDTNYLYDGQVGYYYSCQLWASGGSGMFTWRLVGGCLPRGLRLSSSGQIYGYPREVAYNMMITVEARDCDGRTATKCLYITIRPRSGHGGC